MFGESNLQIPTTLRDLAEDLSISADKLKDTALELDKANSPVGRLVDAMATPLLSEDSLFPKRLVENFTEVICLCKDYAKLQLQRGETVFFESGSTPALLAMICHKQDTHFRAVYTNNKAVSDVLCLSCRVWQTEGWADTKYFGVFPFTSDNSNINEDTAAFQGLYLALKDKVNRLVLDASMFSFLVGPTVSSWQNVCYKAAAYSVPQPIDVLLPCSKVITEVGDVQKTDPNERENTLCWHLTNCYTVFNISVHNDTVEVGDVLPNIEALTKKGEGIFWFAAAAQLLHLKQTWLDVAEANPDLRVWLVAKTEGEIERIRIHLHDRLNPALERLGRPLRWIADDVRKVDRMKIMVVKAERDVS